MVPDLGAVPKSYMKDLVYMYVWQSWVRIEHYSVTQFNCVTTFEVL